MNIFNYIRRKWRAKGHGIHSPFAFHLIRNVIHSPHEYYAFSDMEKTLPDNVLRNKSEMAFYRLSFRLAHHFKAKKVLEIGAKDNVNAKFIEATNKDVCCTDVKSENSTFDAIFIYVNDDEMPTIESLFSLSHNDTFWVIRSIKSKAGKRFWRNVKDDERARITFDVTETGIVFLQPEHHKLNYFV
jgi:hypothetical protein